MEIRTLEAFYFIIKGKVHPKIEILLFLHSKPS